MYTSPAHTWVLSRVTLCHGLLQDGVHLRVYRQEVRVAGLSYKGLVGLRVMYNRNEELVAVMVTRQLKLQSQNKRCR